MKERTFELTSIIPEKLNKEELFVFELMCKQQQRFAYEKTQDSRTLPSKKEYWKGIDNKLGEIIKSIQPLYQKYMIGL